MMRWNGGWGPGAWIGMGLVMLAFWTLVIVAIVALVRGDGWRSGRPERGSDALRILDERLARGEIDADEYRQRRDLLRSG
ncbi:MAG TPA: SHOCT domain-containing protein [Acidimicrobiia bacterium]|nr:SHOCT domain-containing protein [Acidimicrobiia bacterium]